MSLEALFMMLVEKAQARHLHGAKLQVNLQRLAIAELNATVNFGHVDDVPTLINPRDEQNVHVHGVLYGLESSNG